MLHIRGLGGSLPLRSRKSNTRPRAFRYRAWSDNTGRPRQELSAQPRYAATWMRIGPIRLTRARVLQQVPVTRWSC